MNNYLVEKATLLDADALARLILEAMSEIVFQMTNSNDYEIGFSFMKHFISLTDNQYSYQNCWVIKHEGKVICAANVYNAQLLTTLKEPIIQYIHLHINPSFQIEDETSGDEMYIDTIAVDQEYRGLGISKIMLDFLIEFYTNKDNKTLSLLVDSENEIALRLYENKNFKKGGYIKLLNKSNIKMIYNK